MPRNRTFKIIGTGLTGFVLAGVVATRSAAAAIAIDNPSGLECPSAAVLLGAIDAQIGELPSRNRWRLRYLGSTAGIEVELWDQEGRLHLQRRLEAAPGDCQALADATALIIDRFFSDLGWTAGRPLPRPPADLVATRSVDEIPVPAWNFSIEGGAAFWSGSPSTVAGVLGLGLRHNWIAARLLAFAPPIEGRESLGAGGTVWTSTWAAAASLGLNVPVGSWRFDAGPVATMFRTHARSEGIPVTKQSDATTLAIGLLAGASLPLGQRWRLGIAGSVSLSTVGDRFVVGGVGPVLEPAHLQATAFTSLSHSFSW